VLTLREVVDGNIVFTDVLVDLLNPSGFNLYMIFFNSQSIFNVPVHISHPELGIFRGLAISPSLVNIRPPFLERLSNLLMENTVGGFYEYPVDQGYINLDDVQLFTGELYSPEIMRVITHFTYSVSYTIITPNRYHYNWCSKI
jgi:hypothetical protein